MPRGKNLSVYAAAAAAATAAPDATIKQLAITLPVGVFLIFPPYIYLMWTFKRKPGA